MAISGLSGLSGLSGIMGGSVIPPGVSVPGAQSVAWNATLAFTGATAITVTGSGSIEVSLTVSHGTLTLPGLTGLTGSGNGTSSLSYTATAAAWTTALEGLIYNPTDTYAGSDSLVFGGDVTASVGITVVSPTPLGYWKADIGQVFQTVSGAAAGTGDPVGEIIDQGSGAHNATQATADNRPSLSADVPAIFSGEASARSLLFDASNDTIEPQGLNGISGAVTWSGWVKGEGGIFSVHGGNFQNAEHWGIDKDGTEVYVHTGNAESTHKDTSVDASTWLHLAITSTGTNDWIVYADGVSLGTVTVERYLTQTDDRTSFGLSFAGQFGGKIFRPRIDAAAFSVTQIAHFAAGGQ